METPEFASCIKCGVFPRVTKDAYGFWHCHHGCGDSFGNDVDSRLDDLAFRWNHNNRRTTPPDAVTISREHAERIRSALHVSIAGARMTDSEAFYLRGILDAALSGKDTPTD